MEVKSKKGDLSNEAITRIFEFRETLLLKKREVLINNQISSGKLSEKNGPFLFLRASRKK